MKEFIVQNNQAVRFRRFSNTSFAVFRSLKVQVNIGVLAVSMLTFVNTESINAQTATTLQKEKLIEMEEVEVTGSRVPVSLSQTPRILTILTREQISVAPVKSVNDLLKYAVGVDVRQRGQMGLQTDISIRGGNYSQITVLLNGVNINDPQTGHNSVDVPVDIGEIERIEVIEGPAGRVYGTSSLIGAINIVTKTHTKSGASLRAEGGSYGYAGAGVGAYLVGKRFTHQLSGGYSRSDGFTRSNAGTLNNDFRIGKFYYEGNYKKEDVRLKWWAGYSQKDFGANTFYTLAFDNQFEHTAKLYSAVQAETKLNAFHLSASAYWNRYHDRFELVRNDASKYPFNYHRTDIKGAKLNAYVETVLGKTAVGVEVRNEDIVSTKLGETLSSPKRIHGVNGVEYTKGLSRTSTTAHLEHNLHVDRFSLSAGLIAVKHTWNGMPLRLYLGVDMSYRIGKEWTAYASYNTSLRLPDFTELYYKDKERVSDKYLKAEEMRAYEVGVKYLTPSVRATLSLYHNRGKNMIDWIRPTDNTTVLWQAVNHAHINTTGVSASLVLDFAELLPRQSVLQSLHFGYNYLSQSRENKPNVLSRYALEYLRHKFVAQGYFHIYKHLHANVSYRWQERIGSYTNAKKEIKSYRPYGVADARLSWDAPKYTLYAEVNNLFDKVYYDYGDVPQPGFWFQAGVKVRF